MFSLTFNGSDETILFDKITPVSSLESLDKGDCVAFVQEEDVMSVWRLDHPEKGRKQLEELYQLLDSPDISYLQIKLFRLEFIQ